MTRDRSGAAPLAATIVSLVAFVFCVAARVLFRWHPAVTGPLLVASAVALVASVVWLNRWAGSDDGEPEGRPECPYKETCGENHLDLPKHGEREEQ